MQNVFMVNNEQGENLAIIIKANYQKEGIEFFTPDDYSQQLAYMKHPKGKIIDPHIHNKVKRQIHYTQEVLVIKSGKLRVDFYSTQQDYFQSRIIEAGDVILLSSGGHGFKVLEDVEMYEIKQGPYAGEMDKDRFPYVEHEWKYE